MPYHPDQPISVFSVGWRSVQGNLITNRRVQMVLDRLVVRVGGSVDTRQSVRIEAALVFLLRFLVKPRASHLICQIFEIVFEDDFDIIRRVRPNEPGG